MSIGRIIRNSNGFERVTLTDEELQEILRDLREKNLELYESCFKDAMNVGFRKPSLLGPQELHVATEIAGALFDKQAISLETAMNSKLDEKIFYLKEYEKTLRQMEV